MFVKLLLTIIISAICASTPTILLAFNEFINKLQLNESEKSVPNESMEYIGCPFIYIVIKSEFDVSIDINSNNCHVLFGVS